MEKEIHGKLFKKEKGLLTGLLSKKAETGRGASVFVTTFCKVSPLQPWLYDVVCVYCLCMCVVSADYNEL